MANKVAVVTGASAGLGELFATRFAKDGCDVVVVARNEARLERLRASLERVHTVRVHVVPVDLGAAGAAQAVFRACEERGLTVDYLVNNAGFGTHGPFVEQNLEREVEMVTVNCTALLELCHLFGKGMAARRSGRILNIASTAAFQAGPYMATYYATKAFVLSFSEALAEELKQSGVTVTVHCPGATRTEFAKVAGIEKARLFARPGVAKAADVVDDAYEAMMQGEVIAVHGLLNWAAVVGTRTAPRSVTRRLAGLVNQQG